MIEAELIREIEEMEDSQALYQYSSNFVLRCIKLIFKILKHLLQESIKGE